MIFFISLMKQKESIMNVYLSEETVSDQSLIRFYQRRIEKLKEIIKMIRKDLRSGQIKKGLTPERLLKMIEDRKKEVKDLQKTLENLQPKKKERVIFNTDTRKIRFKGVEMIVQTYIDKTLKGYKNGYLLNGKKFDRVKDLKDYFESFVEAGQK